jgi:hypothetical protein
LDIKGETLSRPNQPEIGYVIYGVKGSNAIALFKSRPIISGNETIDIFRYLQGYLKSIY